ncbi:hypothetical protein Vadar_026820 [Vaccinium darrowii]|uniref:Uncharacterized protein n=1 Tax=Vaccinium darrowii TaxID=229202 RepID=A0ACB7YGI6_9ERIC|nr:hypothetical protein Vadar_026820 [Vaccinium darrowii]
MLGVKEAQQDVVHLAAFLTCWLCKIVLPMGSSELIRPGVFKVAAMMARGKNFSLAVPVLASIYRGLNNIAQSPMPGKCDAVFPVHYVHAWLVEYFNTHFSNDSQSSPQKPRMIRYCGDRVARQLDESEVLDLFWKLHFDLRTCSLKNIAKHFESLVREKTQSKLRLPNHEDRRTTPVTRAYLEWWSHVYGDNFRGSVENSARGKRPASPKQPLVKAKKIATTKQRTNPRTTREKGRTSDPVKKVALLNKVTDERSSCEDRNWRHLKNKSGSGTAAKVNVSFNNVDKFFEGVQSSSQPIHANQIEDDDIIHNSKDENFILIDEQQSTSGESVPGPPAFDLVVRQQQRSAVGVVHLPPSSNFPMLGRVAPSTATMFDTGSTILGAHRFAASILDNKIKSVLTKTPLEKLASLRPKLQVIYDEFSKLQLDYTPLQTQIEKYIQNATNYASMKIGISSGMTVEEKAHRLADVDQHLTDAQALDGQAKQRIKTFRFELSGVDAERAKLKRELELLDLKAKKLRESIDGVDAERVQKEHAISTLQSKRATIEAAEVIEPLDMEVANNLESLLMSKQEDIQNLAWLP